LGMISDFNLAQAGAFEGSYVIRLLFGVTVEDMAAINTSEFLVAFLSTPEDAEIPLPATAWLLLASVGGVALIGRRRRQQAA
ncbi:MAG: VPLPA-CTERM sorting domain-containing protein, partial [Pseudomonadota bacterium]